MIHQPALQGGNKFNLMANGVNLIKLMVHKFLTKNIQREVPEDHLGNFLQYNWCLFLLGTLYLSFEKSLSIFKKLIFLAGGVQCLLTAFLINVITDIRWFLQEMPLTDLKRLKYFMFRQERLTLENLHPPLRPMATASLGCSTNQS